MSPTNRTVLPQQNSGQVGLALGGGAVLGAAHIGVLRALDEMHIDVSYVAGTSIGAVIAALFAFGKSWQEIQEIARDVRWLEISGMQLSRYGLLSNEKIGSLIEKHIGDVNFVDSRIPLAIVATDIGRGCKVVLRSGSVARAVRASACIPGVYVPIEHDGSLLVDGGICENVPVASLRDMGADYTIGVDLNASHSFKKPDNLLELLVNTVSLSMITADKMQSAGADLLIAPDLSRFNIYDTAQIDELIAQGYDDAMRYLRQAGNAATGTYTGGKT